MSSSPMSSLSRPLNDFSLTLFHRVSAQSGQDNVCISPLSVSCALSALLLGAKNRSEQQLSKGLRLHLLGRGSADVNHLFQEVSVVLP